MHTARSLALSFGPLVLGLSGCAGPECTSLGDCPRGETCSVDGVCEVSRHVSPAHAAGGGLVPGGALGGDADEAQPSEDIAAGFDVQLRGTLGTLGALDVFGTATLSGGVVSVLAPTERGDALVFFMVPLERGTHLISDQSLSGNGWSCSSNESPGVEHFDEPVSEGEVVLGGDTDGPLRSGDVVDFTATASSGQVDFTIAGTLRVGTI